jgi:hypothetical protein
MKRALPLAFALTVGLSVSARAQTTNPGQLREGTPVVIVGEITSQPRDVGVTHEKKMQLGIGPAKTDYTVHFSDAKLYGYHGKEISGDDFRDKMWVRAEGIVMDDPRRIEARRVEVIGGNLQGVKQTSFYRRGFDQGYVLVNGAPTPRQAMSEGTPVVVVGVVSSPPKGALNEQKMQVAVGPSRTDYTLHFSNAVLIGPNGQKIDEDGLDDGQWVRATGMVMDDPRRIKVSQVQVVADERAGLAMSPYARRGFEYGYVLPATSRVAGARETFPAAAEVLHSGPVVIVGRVSDDTGAFETTRRIQVKAAGNEWTLSVPEDALVVDAKGEKISVHEIDEGQWIRAAGLQTDDLRLKVSRVENIGPEAMFRRSAVYRTQYPLGYIERVAGERMEAGDWREMRGTVLSVNREGGFFMMRDASGREHRVHDRSAANEVRVGDRVIVRERER